MVAGVTSGDMEAVLRAVEKLRTHGPSAEVVQAIETSREAPPVLSRGNSKDSQSKRGKIKTFFSNLFGIKQPESARTQHSASIESNASSVLVDQYASDSSTLLLPQYDLTDVSLNSPLWSEVMSRYRQFGCPQDLSLPKFEDLRSQWRIRE